MSRMKCYECNEDTGFDMLKTVTSINTVINGVKIKVTNIPAYECPNCHEVVISSDVIEKVDSIIAEARKKFSLANIKRMDKIDIQYVFKTERAISALRLETAAEV